MIVDARVLRDDFIPGEIKHRNSEVNELSKTLEPLTEDGQAQKSLIHGPPGTGKTCISQYTLQKLEEEILDLKYYYVNCWENYNRFKVLYKALEGLGKTLQVHRQSTPTDELYSRLRNSVSQPYVLILDEVDQLEDEKVLYDLNQIPDLNLIMIANTEESVFYNMDDRIRSRLMDARRIEFKEYTSDQLEDILKYRVDNGLKPRSIDRGNIRKIALSSEGDARIAIGILRASARKAEEQGMDEITSELIQESIPEAKDRNQQKNVEKLNPHQQELYEIIKEEEEIKPRDLYDRYREEMEDPKSERMLRKYLNKMKHYNLVESEGSGRWTTYMPAEEP
ncbi:MAG: Cdc6/Cdc18 family protein [Candidatus Nanohaloarchaea archaeon]